VRIIAGKFRGRKLVKSDHLKSLRPTTDKNRESLFNILSNSNGKSGFSLVGARVLDLCCGTGAVGFEALSRGAESAVFVDTNREHLELVHKNAALLGVEKQCEIICADAASFNSSTSFDLIFLDPPYDRDYLKLLNLNLLKKNTLLVIEAKLVQPLPLKLLEVREYGSTKFLFLKRDLV